MYTQIVTKIYQLNRNKVRIPGTMIEDVTIVNASAVTTRENMDKENIRRIADNAEATGRQRMLVDAIKNIYRIIQEIKKIITAPSSHALDSMSDRELTTVDTFRKSDTSTKSSRPDINSLSFLHTIHFDDDNTKDTTSSTIEGAKDDIPDRVRLCPSAGGAICLDSSVGGDITKAIGTQTWFCGLLANQLSVPPSDIIQQGLIELLSEVRRNRISFCSLLFSLLFSFSGLFICVSHYLVFFLLFFLVSFCSKLLGESGRTNPDGRVSHAKRSYFVHFGHYSVIPSILVSSQIRCLSIKVSCQIRCLSIKFVHNNIFINVSY